MIDKSFFGEISKVKVSELAAACGFKVVGNRDFGILGVSTLNHATSNELSFFGNKKYKDDLKNTKAGAVILTETDCLNLPHSSVALVVQDVMVGYAKALQILYKKERYPGHICATAVISSKAKIGMNCYIGDYVRIDDDVEIGDNVVIGSNTVIGRACKIGSDGLVGSNVTVSHAIIGNHVIINSGARIGESGFGIIPTGKEMVYIKQLGRVIIGDRVRIGANTTVDRGSIEDTEIGNDTVVDNLVQIAHNVKIGERSIIVSQVGIAGSSEIGNGVVLAGQVGVAGHVKIEDGVVAAAKSGIASDIKAGEVVGGIPAVDVGIWRRQAAFLKMAVSKKERVKE